MDLVTNILSDISIALAMVALIVVYFDKKGKH